MSTVLSRICAPVSRWSDELRDTHVTAQLDSLGLQNRLFVLLDTLVDLPLITLVEEYSDVTVSKFRPDLE